MRRRFANQLALGSFLVSILQGLFFDSGLVPTVQSAVMALVVFYGLGLLCETSWQRVFSKTGFDGSV